MTRDRIITADASQVSGAYFARSLGLKIRTPAEREAEWRAEIEKFADMIERGNEWAVPCPCLADARKLVAERAEQQLTEARPDPFKGRFAA